MPVPKHCDEAVKDEMTIPALQAYSHSYVAGNDKDSPGVLECASRGYGRRTELLRGMGRVTAGDAIDAIVRTIRRDSKQKERRRKQPGFRHVPHQRWLVCHGDYFQRVGASARPGHP